MDGVINTLFAEKELIVVGTTAPLIVEAESAEKEPDAPEIPTPEGSDPKYVLRANGLITFVFTGDEEAKSAEVATTLPEIVEAVIELKIPGLDILL